MSNYLFARFRYNRVSLGDQKNQDELISVFSKQVNPTFVKVIEPLLWFLTQAR